MLLTLSSTVQYRRGEWPKGDVRRSVGELDESILNHKTVGYGSRMHRADKENYNKGILQGARLLAGRFPCRAILSVKVAQQQQQLQLLVEHQERHQLAGRPDM